MFEPKIIPSGTKINDYQIVDLLDAGIYRSIYKVKSTKNNQFYAMKTEDIAARRKTLQTEINIMKQLNEDFFPKVIENGINNEFNIIYLIMDMYGASINTIQLYHNKRLDKITVYNVCYQMLHMIQIFHSYGYVHCDIKPSNFLVQNKNSFPMVLIDFGISQRYIDQSTNKPYPFQKETILSGTKRYASVAVSKGCSCGRKDDLISWFYSFLDLYCGILPWDKSADISDMILKKKSLDISSLNPKFPKELTTLYKYILKLKYGNKPNYDYIRKLFLKCIEKERIQLSLFNWNSFYSNHSNLTVFARELSLKQLKIDLQKERIENENNLKKASSEPIEIQEENLKPKKSSSRLHLISHSKTKNDIRKISIKKLGKTKKNEDLKNKNDTQKPTEETSIKNNEKEKHKSKKYPPLIPSTIKK